MHWFWLYSERMCIQNRRYLIEAMSLRVPYISTKCCQPMRIDSIPVFTLAHPHAISQHRIMGCVWIKCFCLNNVALYQQVKERMSEGVRSSIAWAPFLYPKAFASLSRKGLRPIGEWLALRLSFKELISRFTEILHYQPDLIGSEYALIRSISRPH